MSPGIILARQTGSMALASIVFVAVADVAVHLARKQFILHPSISTCWIKRLLEEQYSKLAYHFHFLYKCLVTDVVCLIESEWRHVAGSPTWRRLKTLLVKIPSWLINTQKLRYKNCKQKCSPKDKQMNSFLSHASKPLLMSS